MQSFAAREFPFEKDNVRVPVLQEAEQAVTVRGLSSDGKAWFLLKQQA